MLRKSDPKFKDMGVAMPGYIWLMDTDLVAPTDESSRMWVS